MEPEPSKVGPSDAAQRGKKPTGRKRRKDKNSGSSVKENELKIMPIGVSSIFWDHFGFPQGIDSVLNHSKVFCKFCSKHVKMSVDVVYNMRVHLMQCRPAIFAELKAAEAITPLKVLTVIPAKNLNSSEAADEYDSEDRDFDEEESEGEIAAKDCKKMSDKEWDRKMQNNSFELCVRLLCPNYFDPSHDDYDLFFTSHRLERLKPDQDKYGKNVLEMVPEKVEMVKAKLVKKIKALSEYSLSIEKWNSNLTVSINYLEGPLMKNSILITQDSSKYSNRCMDKPKLIKTLEADWAIKKEKIVAVVASLDTASDEKFCWEEQLEVPVIPCFLDFLDKLVQEKLFKITQIDELVSENVYDSEARKSVIFHNMEHYWDKFYFKLKSDLTDVENQWSLTPTKKELHFLKQLDTFLDGLYLALETMRREHPYGMVSTLWPILNILMTENFAAKEEDEPFQAKLKRKALTYTTKIYSKVLPFLQAATKIDPRFRTMHAPQENAEALNKIFAKALASELKIGGTSEQLAIKKPRLDQAATFNAEFAKFCASQPSDFLICPIKWWLHSSLQNVQEEYPLINEMAKKFTCIPSSCIPQRRMLNDKIYEQRENVDEDDYLQDFLFLWSNYKLLN